MDEPDGRASAPVDEHRRAARGRTARCVVLTVSDTRTAATDVGGDLLVRLLVEAGHEVVDRRLVRDEPGEIAAVLDEWLGSASAADLMITTGGTGIGPRDGTVEAVSERLDKKLDGFGELFRMLSFEQIGAAAMMSRAVAGLAGKSFLVALPGSPDAIALALERLLLPELGHLLRERDRRSA